MGIRIPLSLCIVAFSMYSVFIHRNIQSLFELFLCLLSAWHDPKAKVSYGISYLLKISWEILCYIIDEPTSQPSILSYLKDMADRTG
jgi:hypothetical protein